MYKVYYIILLFMFNSCNQKEASNLVSNEMTAEKLLGNVDYQAICYGGYRTQTRDKEPSIAEIKEDMKILSAMNIKVVRTYNVHHKEASNLLNAISELKKEDAKFEMYVMLGAWIDCKNAWTALPTIHNEESSRNAVEIDEAVRLANEFPDIVKIIAVGNEAMVKWATSYYVTPNIILKWVNHLQNLKKNGKLSKEVWITSSDNFASWGGGGKEYHVDDLNQLIKAVDYISMHTYPMHDTHYNPVFWGIKESEMQLTDKEKIDAAMIRARDYSVAQYNSVVNYMKSIGVNKPVHIGETGWATVSNEHYGNEGSKATDEYKSALFYNAIRAWTNKEKITCFYFEAFDENWKDSANPMGSENHFGLINLQSQAKYALWESIDKGAFKGLIRNGKPITKTYNGDEKALWLEVKTPTAILKN
jgi:exo-beta-1,3-glucanase (GH17 family)